MGDPYTDVTVLNYNDDAPSDDGAENASNQIKWATVKDEVGDPLKTAIESLNTNVGAAVDKLIGGAGVNSQSAGYTIVAGDQGKLVRITSAGTVTTADATVVTSPFVCMVSNASSGTLTIDGSGAQTIDGQSTITLPPGAGVTLFTDGSNWFTAGRGNIQDASSFVVTLPQGYLSGLGTSNNSTDSEHDIDIATGTARDSTDAFTFTITSTHVKRIDASWATGSAAGGLASALSLSADTWYHVFLVDDGSGTTEAGFDTSLTATNLLSDTGGSYYRRIASVLTDSSSNIIAYKQVGDYFYFEEPRDDYSSTDVPTALTAITVDVPPIGCMAEFRIEQLDANGGSAYVFDGSYTGSANPSSNTAGSRNNRTTLTTSGADVCITHMTLYVNTSSEIKIKAAASSLDLALRSVKWIDPRT